MSLIPDFELGLWNAWILVLPMHACSVALAKIINVCNQ